MLILEVFLLFCILLKTYGKEIRYDDYKVHRIVPKNQRQLNVLRSLEYDAEPFEFWNGPTNVGESVDIMVSPNTETAFTKFKLRNSIASKILIPNVQQRITQEIGEIATDCVDQFLCNYHSIAEINTWLHDTSIQDTRATLIKIGKTYEGRDITGLKITFSPNNENRAIIVESTIHAREWIAASTTLYFINELLTNVNETVRQSVELYDWYIFPVINVDGYEYTRTTDRLWRKTRVPYQYIKQNCPSNPGRNFGADPNRNFDFFWGKTNSGAASKDPCSDIYAGPKPFSEPCVIALKNFIDGLARSNQLLGFITLHSYGQKMLLPYGYPKDNEAQDNAKMMAIAGKASEELHRHFNTVYTVGPLNEILYMASGVSFDWVKNVYKIPLTLGFELRDTGNYGFLLPRNQIRPTGIETFYGIWKLVEEFALNPWSN